MSQSIVINRCFGGFGLSHIGVMHYAKLAGLTLYPYRDSRAGPRGLVPYDEVTGEEGLCIHYLTSPVKDDRSYAKDSYFSLSDIKRDDPHLVATVRALGETADGPFAKLKIVEIPNGVSWEIDEYDGRESVEESHSSWS